VYGENMREIDLIAMSDSAYNGGYGGLRKDIRLCTTTKGCNPKVWFDNVENTCTKSKRKLYGNMSACQINRRHVRDILFRRTLKYHFYMRFRY
jgi:membrane-bound lytic murein transglycosylase MltF